MSTQDDPEVQRNGFEVILEGVGVDPKAMEDWFEGETEDAFDPAASWDENLRRFREHLQGADDLLNNTDQEDLEAMLDAE